MKFNFIKVLAISALIIGVIGIILIMASPVYRCLIKAPMPTMIESYNLTKTVLFAHNSVGSNILQGVTDVVGPLHFSMNADYKSGYTIDEIVLDKPGIFGYELGYNGDPEAKLKAFEEVLSNVSGINVAVFKFCYVDIKIDTDMQELIKTYMVYMSRIQTNHPHIRFIHTTIPLTARPLVQKLKSINGNSDADVIRFRRHNFNEFIRNTYTDVFDIASIESKGMKETFTYKGYAIPVLYEGYTIDGGHLNKAGGAIVAKEFLMSLNKP